MDSGASARTPLQLVSHALGNVFLGIAIGLLGYYLLTDASARVQQEALAHKFPVTGEQSVVDDRFDWDGWETEDAVYWGGLDEGDAFGRLQAPAMGLDTVVVKGTQRRNLMKGPGWMTYTDLPGPKGNFGIAGHRTTYGAPFRHMDRLREGDTVTLTSPYRVYVYRVKRVFAVSPDRVDVVETTEGATLTMTACHPPYSAKQRLITQSELVAVKRVKR